MSQDGEAAPRRSAHRRAVLLAVLCGLAILALVLSQAELATLVHRLAGFGVGGVLVMVLLRALPTAFTAEGWAVVLRGVGVPARWPALLWPRLVGDYVNLLLPVASVGGEVARALLLIDRGRPRAEVTASILVDLTLALLALLVFVVLGLALLAGLGAGADWRLLLAALGGATALLVLFYGLQRRGVGWLIRLSAGLFGDQATSLHQGWAACEALLVRLYSRPGLVLRGTFWRLLAWFAGALEIGVAAWWLGEFPGVAALLALEAVAQVFRNAGFAIPAALGAQEAGYVVGAGLVGLPTEVGLALAVIKRARDLVIGIPVLCVWQWQWLSHRLKREI
jgi:putative membrane protein